jgi:Ricin-type beta-trefoil lectin domain-like/Chaperone of endosialidase
MSKRGAPSARHLALGLLALASLLVLCLPGSAQPAEVCDQIRAACEKAGFAYGAVKSGNGLWVDCIRPIMQGKSQPADASRPLPPVDPQIVTACKASNPSFGQGPASEPPAPSKATSSEPPPPGGGKYLDAKSCSDTLNLNPGSDFDNGSCQLWQVVPDADGWSRLQLKRNGKFLDAKNCTDELHMNPLSTYDNGSCQLWKFARPDADGWSRIQIKRNGKFLDANQCSDDLHLSDLSTYAGGACQLWRLVPVPGGGDWARLQIKYTGGAAPAQAGGAPPAVAADDEFDLNGDTYGWYDDGWDGAGWYIVGYEFRRGFGFGGHEGWHGWHHHGSHSHHGGGGHHGVEHRGGGERHGGEHHGGGGRHGGGGGGHHAGGHRGGGGGGHRGGGGGGHRGGGGGGHRGGGGHHGGGGGHHGGGGGHHGGRRSDIRLKHDIVMLGHLDNGLGFYRFSYNGSDKAYVGVMAQEVQAVVPEAVVRGSDGYLRVYYDRLGLRMQTWDEWVASGQRIPTAAPTRH